MGSSANDSPEVVADRFEAVELDDEVFLLDHDTGDTYRMNRTGTTVWRHLASGSTVTAALVELEHAFAEADVSREQIAADVDGFLRVLYDAGALRSPDG